MQVGPPGGATASALLRSPLTRNHTDSWRGCSAAKVRLIRSGGGLGEPVTRYGDPVVDVELREAGEQRGDVAVGADAEHHHVELAARRAPASSSAYAAAPASTSAASAVDGISCTLAGSAPTVRQEGRAGLAGVAVG